MTRLEYSHMIWSLLPERKKAIDSYAQIVDTWWYDARSSATSMRLTESGHELLRSIPLEHWTFASKEMRSITARHLLTLASCLLHPYFIQTSRRPAITFYHGPDATFFALCGSVDLFVERLR